MLINITARSLLAGAILSATALNVSATNMDSAITKGVERVVHAQKAQQRIDAVDAHTRSAEREYRGVLKQVEGLTVYISQLDKQLDAQQQEQQKISDSIHQVSIIERQITPLMLRMIDAIEQFVQVDVPFLKQERVQRITKLKDLMARADVTVAEKYRKVMQAYQTELEYGRTIEAYRGEIQIDGQNRAVDFLRTGRISLTYQTLDGKKQGVWDSASQDWQTLDSAYKSNISKGIRIAREQTAPGLIKVPVSAPTLATLEIK
ncbi:MAG: DUF3450 domain-containing protein [Bermanella sp.]